MSPMYVVEDDDEEPPSFFTLSITLDFIRTIFSEISCEISCLISFRIIVFGDLIQPMTGNGLICMEWKRSRLQCSGLTSFRSLA